MLEVLNVIIGIAGVVLYFRFPEPQGQPWAITREGQMLTEESNHV